MYELIFLLYVYKSSYTTHLLNSKHRFNSTYVLLVKNACHSHLTQLTTSYAAKHSFAPSLSSIYSP